MRLFITFLFVLATFSVLGCAGGERPVVTPENDQTPSEPVEINQGTHILLSGTMNLDDGSLELHRDNSGYIDVTAIVGGNFSYQINGMIPPDILDLTLSLTNASPLMVYDVNIVFSNLYGKKVLNPDSYTDIFNPGSINPFISFRKEITDRAFPPQVTDEQNLLLKWPAGTSPLVDFFIIAHLPGNTGGVYQIKDWNVLGTFYPNGSVDVEVSVLDHQGDITAVLADTRIFNNALTPFTQESPPIWSAVINDTNGVAPGDYTVLVGSTSPAVPQYITYNYFPIRVGDAPHDPTIIGTINPPGYVRDVDVAGDYAYVAGSRYFHVIDVSNKEEPFVAGSYEIPGYPDHRQRGIKEKNDYVYLINSDEDQEITAVFVFDVHDKFNPDLINRLAFPGEHTSWPDLVLQGDYLYANGRGNPDGNLHVIDISNPILPYIEETIPDTLHGVAIEVNDNQAFITSQLSPYFQIVDLTTNEIYAPTTGYMGPLDMDWENNHAFIANQWGNDQTNPKGFKIIQTIPPYNVYEYDTVSRVDSVAVQDGYAYLLCYFSSSLEIFDVNDPANAVHMYSVPDINSGMRIHIDGQYAYITNWSGLIIVKLW